MESKFFLCFVSLVVMFVGGPALALEVNECTVNTTCVPLNVTSCLGIDIQHSHTSFELHNQLSHQAIVNKLKEWGALSQVPRCWDKLQPLLCSIYMPKCENGEVERPSRRMCKDKTDPCIVVEVEKNWPWFLMCNSSIYVDDENAPSTCENVYKSVNATGSACKFPLIETSNELSWYEHVEGCGITCQNILFDAADHARMHTFIAVMASLCLVLTFFTLVTFCADWKTSGRYPAVILFYMNGCFFMASIGFLAQFPARAREDITCRSDGTRRVGEPSEGENLSCLIVFVIAYYFIMAGVHWFIVLAYAWHLSFKALGTPVDALQGKTGYFHVISWTFPFIMIVIILACNKVDGDSLTGICFVGYMDKWFRALFVLTPMSVAQIIAGFFLFSGLMTLLNLDKDNPGLLNEKAAVRIKGTIARIGVFGFVNFLFVMITLSCHAYDFVNSEAWESSVTSYLLCRANASIEIELGAEADPEECYIRNKPSLSFMIVHLFSFFGAGISMSTWVWTPSSVAIWKRTWRKITCQPINEPVKLKKSKMIAKAFAKRMQKRGGAGNQAEEEEENLSVSFESASHDDAIAMKFDLPQSDGSIHSSSSNWGNNVPVRMLARRGAAMPVATISNSSSPVPSQESVQGPFSVPRPPSVLCTTEAVVEAPPLPPSRRKSRSRRRAALVMHQPSRAETPMCDDLIEENDDFITLNAPQEGRPATSGFPSQPSMPLHSHPVEQTWTRSKSGKRLERGLLPPLPPPSKVPKLPAIQVTKKNTVQSAVRFDVPDEVSEYPLL